MASISRERRNAPFPISRRRTSAATAPPLCPRPGNLGRSVVGDWIAGAAGQASLRPLPRAFPFDIEAKAFSIHVDLTGPELIDLTPYLREDILLNLPAHPHCDREGGRVCPAASQPDTGSRAPDGAEKRPPDWSALDKLNYRSSGIRLRGRDGRAAKSRPLNLKSQPSPLFFRFPAFLLPLWEFPNAKLRRCGCAPAKRLTAGSPPAE